MLRPRWDEDVRWHEDQVTAPTGTVVDLTYLRLQHLRLTTTQVEDPRLTRALSTATQQAEYVTRRALLPQVWALVMDRLPVCGEIVLPRLPLISVTKVEYVDDDGVTQTLATSEYTVLRQTGPKCRRSEIVRAYDVTWPSVRRQRDAVTITYRVGYVEDPDASPEVVAVPDDIKEGIAMRAAEFYKHRSDSVIGFGITVTPAIVASRQLWSAFTAY